MSTYITRYFFVFFTVCAAPLLGYLLELRSQWKTADWVEYCASQGGCPPEDSGFSLRVKGLPPWRGATADERRAFLEDGVTRFRGAVPDRNLTDVLRSAVQAGLPSFWYINGILKAFIRDGPLPALAADLLEVGSVAVWSSAAFNQGPSPTGGEYIPEGPPLGGVHIDLDSSPGYLLPFVTMWVSLTDNNHTIEWLAGSHKANAKYDCPYGSQLTLWDPCMVRLQSDPECNGRRWWDIATGDVVAFYSQVYHWVVLQPFERSAVSLRFIDANHRVDFFDQGAYMTFASLLIPRLCSPVKKVMPVVYPREDSTLEAVWPLKPRKIDLDRFRFYDWGNYFVRHVFDWSATCREQRESARRKLAQM